MTPISTKLAQDVCLHEHLMSLNLCHNVGDQVEFNKNLVNTLEAILLAQSLPNMVRMFVCMKDWMISKLGLVWSKSRSRKT